MSKCDHSDEIIEVLAQQSQLMERMHTTLEKMEQSNSQNLTRALLLHVILYNYCL